LTIIYSVRTAYNQAYGTTRRTDHEIDVVETSFVKENDSALYETLEVRPPTTYTRAVQPEDQASTGIYELDNF